MTLFLLTIMNRDLLPPSVEQISNDWTSPKHLFQPEKYRKFEEIHYRVSVAMSRQINLVPGDLTIKNIIHC